MLGGIRGRHRDTGISVIRSSPTPTHVAAGIGSLLAGVLTLSRREFDCLGVCIRFRQPLLQRADAFISHQFQSHFLVPLAKANPGQAAARSVGRRIHALSRGDLLSARIRYVDYDACVFQRRDAHG